jgi:thiamine pyrophosphokinase
MSKEKTALILLNGEKPSQGLLEPHWQISDLRICADGAAAVCDEYGLYPDVILGDLDSLKQDTKKHLPLSQIIEAADQDYTDGEKAIQFCINAGVGKINLFGALGKRSDHALYNLGLLRTFHREVSELTIYSDDDTVLLISGEKTFSASPGTRISLLPIFGRVENVITQGLKYALKRKHLELGYFSSVSNSFSDESATVSFSSGLLLVVIGRQNQI